MLVRDFQKNVYGLFKCGVCIRFKYDFYYHEYSKEVWDNCWGELEDVSNEDVMRVFADFEIESIDTCEEDENVTVKIKGISHENASLMFNK